MSAGASESHDQNFDVVVIGGGPAAEVLAGRLGEAGMKVAVVERRLVGGECSYYACMPSKALLAPGQVLAAARRVPGVAELIGEGHPDAAAVLERRDEIIHRLDDSGQVEWLGERGVTVLRGHGKLDGERRVLVDGMPVEARHAVVIATGSEPTAPPVPGLDDIGAWTNVEGTTADRVPGTLVVVGGGVVGVELAQAWASLGSQVALVEFADRLIAREEEFASRLVREGLQRDGVSIHTGRKVVRAWRDEGAQAVLELDDGERLIGDEILIAAGRKPLVAGLGLDSVGLGEDRALEVGADLRVTNQEWLYAIGDVNGRAPLTHSGKYQAAVAADNILAAAGRAGGLGERTLAGTGDGATVPRVIFTDPQVAAVGHTLASAAEAGIEVEHVDHPADGIAGSSFAHRETGGNARLVFTRDGDMLVGATFVGTDVAELLHAATIAIGAELTARQLHDAVPAFPTRSEVWLRLLDRHLYPGVAT